MTVVAMLKYGGVPFFLGDILITSTAKPKIQISIPVSSQISEHLSRFQVRSICGLTQKISILSDRLIVAVAGDENQAKDFVETLSFLALLPDLDEVTFSQYTEAIEPNRTNNLQAFGAIIIPDGEEGDGLWIKYFCINLEKINSGVFKDSYIAGSGKDGLIEILENMPANEVNSKTSNNAYIAAAQLGLIIATQLFGIEFTAGNNLLESWGGGFELAVFRNGRFEKFSDVVYLFFRVIKTGKGKYSLQLVRKIVKLNYFEEILLIRTIEITNKSGEQSLDDRVHIIFPIHKRDNDYEISDIPTPDFGCKTLCTYIIISDPKGGADCASVVHSNEAGIDKFRYTIGSNDIFLSFKKDFVEELLESARKFVNGDIVFDRIGS